MKKRRINTTVKGRRLQLLARKALEADGYDVEACRPTIAWIAPGKAISKATDFWGRIDLIAVHPERPPKLIQVSVPSELSRKKATIGNWNPAGCEVEIWIRLRGKFARYQRTCEGRWMQSTSSARCTSGTTSRSASTASATTSVGITSNQPTP